MVTRRRITGAELLLGHVPLRRSLQGAALERSDPDDLEEGSPCAELIAVFKENCEQSYSWAKSVFREGFLICNFLERIGAVELLKSGSYAEVDRLVREDLKTSK